MKDWIGRLPLSTADSVWPTRSLSSPLPSCPSVSPGVPPSQPKFSTTSGHAASFAFLKQSRLTAKWIGITLHLPKLFRLFSVSEWVRPGTTELIRAMNAFETLLWAFLQSRCVVECRNGGCPGRLRQGCTGLNTFVSAFLIGQVA